MDKESRRVIYSAEYSIDLEKMFDYGVETFGRNAAASFLAELYYKTENLSSHFELYPECRFLPTKSHKYRNLFTVIYRIASERIEVLRAFHGSQSIRKLKSSRKIKPE